MAIQLVFSKSDDAPWGFRLTGGADCEIPLTVIKIATGGIADAAGLLVGDVIIDINDHCTEDLSHIEAHDVLMEAGQNFIMTVLREPVNPHDDEQHNEEVRNILQQSFQEEFQQVLDQNSFSEDIINPDVIPEIQPQQKSLRVHFNDEILQDTARAQKTEEQNKETPEFQQKKWSTFLQKPKRAVVLPKTNNIEKPVGEQYKVVIKKQPKKNLEKVDNETIDVAASDIELQDNAIETVENADESMNSDDKTFEQNTAEFEEINDIGHQSDLEETQTDNESDLIEETLDVEEVVQMEEHLSLEERLAQIQQQLQSLAQVPTSIQDTLGALTEQLAKIVGVPQTQQHLEQIVLYEEGDNEDEEHAYDDNLLASITEEAAEALDSSDEYKLDITDTTDISEDEHEDEIRLLSPEDELKLKQAQEFDQERQKLEVEKAVKQERTEEFHQRRLEQRPTIPLAPVQRPIILPGGRKWSEPEDALPKPRKSKMTDEKICETLDNYSEIVAGHTKGINFLKYQPSPKNLDYLQRSEVFRLVHDMDTPKSGIATRSGIIVSEEDYYRHNPGHHNSVKV